MSMNSENLPFQLFFTTLKVTYREKCRQIKLQRLQKVGTWIFGSLVRKINSL